MSMDRLNDVWTRLVRLAVGMLAPKTVDACALYWGTVAAINGSKVDVTLDTNQIPSPSNVPLFLGLPSSTVEGIAGQRVLVGFRNGDISQPYAIAFEFSATSSLITIGTSTPKEAARKDDAVKVNAISAATGTSLTFSVVDSLGVSGTINITVGGGALVVVLAPPTMTAPFTHNGTITAGSSHVKIGG